jgi:histidyl-tRNA synthetase
MLKVTKPRGFNDLAPKEFEHKSNLLDEIKNIFKSYFFKEIETPIVEKKELFIRSVGEETDIVNKEMFTFQDRKGEHLVLRPEGTAGCLRFAIAYLIQVQLNYPTQDQCLDMNDLKRDAQGNSFK